MKYLKHSKRKSALKILLGVCCIVAVFAAGVLVGLRVAPQNTVLRQPDEKVIQPAQTVTEETKIQVAPEENTVAPAPVVEDGNFGIDTKYCELRYPQKWVKYVDFEMKETDNTYVVEFYGLASEGKYHLFDVSFGTETGYVLGSILYENVEIPVAIEIYDIPAEAQITDEERFELNMMCEDVNVIISNLMEQRGFTAWN